MPVLLPTDHRGSTSHRRNSRVGDDGSLAAGSNVFRRTQDERDQAPGASKLDMAHYLKKLEKELTITPQRMRMSAFGVTQRGEEENFPPC